MQRMLEYRDKDFLKSKLKKGLFYHEIADICNVSTSTIHHWVKEYSLCNTGIEIRRYNMGNKISHTDLKQITKERLYYLHKILKKTPLEISDMYNCHPATIRNRLNKYNIKLNKTQESAPEYKIKEWLESQDIIYEQEYTFEDCRDEGNLRFDFAILDEYGNIIMLIEYDGYQHFEPVEKWGGEEYLKEIQKRDQIKDKYCKENNIDLMRITREDLKGLS